MEKSDTRNWMNKPTMLQIKYLEELRRTPKKRGVIARIAQKCQVNHAAVSRFLKECVESGYINENYELSESGALWLHQYVELRGAVTLYFRELGLSEEEALENTKVVIESMDIHTLWLMLKSKERRNHSSIWNQNNSNINIGSILEKGTFKIGFQLLQYDQKERKVVKVSMADQGFYKPAILQKNNRGVYLELEVKDMRAVSRITGLEMAGHLTGLKYEENGVIIKPEIRNRKVKIPLDVFRITITGEGRIQGTLQIMTNCSVGRKHMPESSALLVIWL